MKTRKYRASHAVQCIVIPCLMAVFPPFLAAQTCSTTWISSTGGSWSDGQNWDTGDPPGSTDIVCITLDQNVTVQIDTDVQISTLVLGSSASQNTQLLELMSSKSLGVQSGIDVYQSGQLNILLDAVVGGSAGFSLNNRGIVSINGGEISMDISNFGDFYFLADSKITRPFSNLSGGVVQPADSGSAADLELSFGMTNSGTVLMNGQENLSITIVSGQKLLNQAGGVIRAGTTTKTIPQAPRAGTTPPAIVGEVSNSGSILVGDTGLTLLGEGTASSNEAGGVIQVVYQSFLLDLTGSTTLRAASSFTNLGTIDIGTGTSFNVSTVAGKSGERAASSFTNLGTIDISTGASFNISQGAKTPGAASSFTNLGTIDIQTGATFYCDGVGFQNAQNSRASCGVIGGGGSLDISDADSFLNDGVIRPGDPTTAGSVDTLTIFGNLVQGPSASLEFDISGTEAGSTYDQLDIHGSLEREGDLRIGLVGSYMPQESDAFSVLTHTGATGSYTSSVSWPDLDNGLEWSIEEGESATALHVDCTSGDDLEILDVTEDKDPVSIDSILTFSVTVESVLGNIDVELDADLGSNLILHEVLAGDCDLNGLVLECDLGEMLGLEGREIEFSVMPTISGDLPVPFTLSGYQCEMDNADNSFTAVVHAIAAAPCDANYDGYVDENDPPVAAAHFFGSTAPGNPDCSDDGVLDARDLALIIEEAGS